jgi:hypothetical protein
MNCCAVLVALVSLLASHVACDQFDVKPHVPGVIGKEVTVGKQRFKCEFQYKCTGGSLEAWDIDVLTSSSWSDGKEQVQLECVVARPNPPSYIVFTEFQVSFKGPKTMQIAGADVADNDGPLADGTAWLLNKRKLRSKDGWSGAVNSIKVRAIA